MIKIKDVFRCCGCGSCSQKCPHSCISMNEDAKGFLYPTVDMEKCVDCHLCENVCPYNNELNDHVPIVSLAAINPDEDSRQNSSSGGVFSLLAEDVIKQGGVVFGAKFNEKWEVNHGYTSSVDGIKAFRGSKYVQSTIGDCFIEVEDFLCQDLTVLFSGTPCQIASLRLFLKKEYDNLLTIEVACHGVPSPKLWREYIKKRIKKGTLNDVQFRDKSTGWKDYSVRIGKSKKRHDDDDYMICFLTNYALRPSCFNCPAKKGKSGADITLADFWGIQNMVPSMDDNKGTNLVIVNSEKGIMWIKKSGIDKVEVNYSKAVSFNSAIVQSTTQPKDYDNFWDLFSKKPTWAIKRYSSLKASLVLLKMKRLVSKLIR